MNCLSAGQDKAVIRLLANDYKVKDIAAISGKHPHSVSMQLARLREAHGVQTNCALIAKALREGLIL